MNWPFRNIWTALWWLKGILWKQVWVYINNLSLWKWWGHRFTLHMHATFAVSLTAMSLYRGAEIYWMHQKVQYYTFSPTTTSLTCILQFLISFLLSRKCSSFLVRLQLCKHCKIKQYSQNCLSDFHPLHNKENLFVVQGWSANCFSSPRHTLVTWSWIDFNSQQLLYCIISFVHKWCQSIYLKRHSQLVSLYSTHFTFACESRVLSHANFPSHSLKTCISV